MIELVVANLRVRPFRTLISVIGVALGVVLVVLFTGLARGMTNDMAKRASNWKAEIVFTRPGAMGLDSSNAPVPTAYTARLLEIDGVQSTVPVFRYITPSSKGRWGIQQIDGVDWVPFAEMNEMRIVDGRAPLADQEIILDERQIRDDNVKIGEELEFFGGRKYTIVGVFSPPSGSRIKMTLNAMQQALERPDKCTYILVKLNDGNDVDAVAARINEELPGNKVNLTRDLVIDAQERIPALNTFLRVLVGLGAFVSTIFVLLSLYTTVTERRKEIGILKSLGASKAFIIRSIEGEAFLIGILGVVLGLITAFAASILIGRSFDLTFEFSSGWVATAVLIAIGGSLFGALYPALRASAIDPVEVMANE
ncbi:MAG: ABC transporter permease [Blastocatellia bacterium]